MYKNKLYDFDKCSYIKIFVQKPELELAVLNFSQKCAGLKFEFSFKYPVKKNEHKKCYTRRVARASVNRIKK